jgi:thiamine-phosphate pyrophosphorylase
LIFIVDASFEAPAPEEIARLALSAGVDALQLRAKDMDTRPMVRLASRLAILCRGWDRPFFVNDRVDVALASGADGVHLGPRDLPAEVARKLLGPAALIGISVYGPEDLLAARKAGASYVSVGAVFPTRTKDLETVGLDGIRRFRAATDLPLVGIGGIGPENADRVISAGADGVAVISCLYRSGNPEETVALLRAKVGAARDGAAAVKED